MKDRECLAKLTRRELGSKSKRKPKCAASDAAYLLKPRFHSGTDESIAGYGITLCYGRAETDTPTKPLKHSASSDQAEHDVLQWGML